jgi:translation machinery-associated protein 16
MAPTKKPQKTAKKEKVFHPESRKAGQLARKQIRKSKLTGQASKRAKLHSAKGKLVAEVFFNSWLMIKIFYFPADFYGFFFHAIPEGRGCVLTLPELHELVIDVWLTRHDAELEGERAGRRKGRPKSTKEEKLEQVKLLEAEEYRTGMGERALLFFVEPSSCFPADRDS